MIYVRDLTDDERKELRRMTRQEIGRVAQRAQIVLLSAQRRTVPEIAVIFAMSRATVRFWIERFNGEGPNGLYDEPRSGRPRQATSIVEQTIVQSIQKDPSEDGHLATFWTVAMIALALVNKLHIQLSGSTVRGTLVRLGLRWGRPRLAMPKKVDPEKASKQWLIAEALIASTPETAFLYADESRMHLLPLLRSLWHWIGEQVRIPTPGTNDTRAIFGALDIRTGRWTHLVRQRMSKEDFIAFLEHLLAVYVDVPIVLVVDNYSSHHATVVKEWLETHDRLHLFYLPTYCSHLNPVERIWLQLKNTVAANRLYGSMTILLQTVDKFFQTMSATQALVWASA
jgi:transposase